MGVPNWIYELAVYVLTRIVGIFFREVNQRGAYQIPPTGPVIFVIAPHANQFVDPLIVLMHCRRKVGYLIAKKSWDKKYIGSFARVFQAIPVPRSQDYAFAGSGKIHVGEYEESAVYGEGTKFLSELQVKASITISGVSETMDVKEIVSDTKLIVQWIPKEARDILMRDEKKKAAVSYKVLPHLDQSKVYEAVNARLNDGECIGIFPEGGSHDRAEMLPLKAGVTIMAMGAMASNPGLDVRIVPVGLNYFHAHKFRSRAVVEFGKPISVSKEMLENYKAGGSAKREACGALLDEIYNGLRNVTVNTSDYEALQVVQAARRLYRPTDHNFSLAQTIQLTRRLAEAYSKLSEEPSVKACSQKVLEYNLLLRTFGLHDHQVNEASFKGMTALRRLVMRVIKAAITLGVALPGLLLNLPIIVVCVVISDYKAKEAKNASSVKIAGRDVITTWKLLVALVLTPILYTLYAMMAAILSLTMELPTKNPLQSFLLTLVALPIISFYTIKFGETGIETFRSIPPLVLALIPFYRKEVLNLQLMRAKLETEIITLIDNLGPTIYPDFHENRLVRHNKVRKQKLKKHIETTEQFLTTDGGDTTGSEFEGDWLNWRHVTEDEYDDVFFSNSAAQSLESVDAEQ